MTSATIPIPGRINTYTSGCAKNQNKCCHKIALPPPLPGKSLPLMTRPLGTKKLVPATRSINCITLAASSGGNASSNRNAVTNCAHTKNGIRMNVSPFVRSWMMVTMKLTEPSSDEVIRNTIPTSHIVCPRKIVLAGVTMTDNGAYEVQPDCAAPSGTKKLANMITPPIKYTQ